MSFINPTHPRSYTMNSLNNMTKKNLIMMGKEVTFPIAKGHGLVLWRNYNELTFMIDLFIVKGEGAMGRFNDYVTEDKYENVISARQDGLWTMHKYPVGDKQSIYFRFKDKEEHSHIHGTYVAWSTFVLDNNQADYQHPSHSIKMYCGFCGKDTSQVDMEYLAGTDHLECKLKDEMAIMNGTTC